MIIYAHAHGFSCPINRLNGSVFCFAVVFPRYTSGDEVNKQLYSTMASSVTLEVFNPDVESVDDCKERFDFHCTANQVSRERKKALFLTRIGRDAFVKLKTLASLTLLSELLLEQILSTMKQHYKRETVEIAERFKFFKCVQQDMEGVAECITELRKLGKTCNFDEYLDTALCNQLICGLKDHKTQKELLCIQDLTLAMAIEKARAAEAVDREILHFPAVEADALKLYSQQKACQRCGQHGHTGATCRHKNTHCHVCKKLGHLSSVCWHNQQQELPKQQLQKHKKQSRSTHTMHASADGSSEEEEEFDTNQLYIHKTSRSHTDKITTVLAVSGIKVEMEVSTMPMAVYKQKLSHVRLCPSTVRLHQYDGTTLPTKGEIEVAVTTYQQRINGKFVIVDIPNDQLPLLGRDWLLKLRLDWPRLLGYNSVHKVDEMSLRKEFPDVFRKELGLLQGVEAVIELKEGSKARFCKSSNSFCTSRAS